MVKALIFNDLEQLFSRLNSCFGLSVAKSGYRNTFAARLSKKPIY